MMLYWTRVTIIIQSKLQQRFLYIDFTLNSLHSKTLAELLFYLLRYYFDIMSNLIEMFVECYNL